MRRPSKKFRGQRRYYRKLFRKAAGFELDLAAEHWYNLWHQHLDWKGYSNLGAKHRRVHLQALFQLYRNLWLQTQQHSRECQVWALVVSDDGSEDAVYIHSPNPHTHFPFEFTDVSWDIEMPQFLGEVTAGNEWQLGISETSGEAIYYVRPR